MSTIPEGNTNYVLIPDSPVEQYGGVFKQGRATVIMDEVILGTDKLWNEDQFDLQWNFFNAPQVGADWAWWQIIVQPSIKGYGDFANHFQLWLVKATQPGQSQAYVSSQGASYWVRSFSIGDWAQSLFQKGTVATLLWVARTDNINDRIYAAGLQITKPDGRSNYWQIGVDELGSAVKPTDIILNNNTSPNGGANHVFSITGSDGGSFYTATQAKGRVFYNGVHPINLIGLYTAESSNIKYGLITLDNFGDYFSTFSV
jgi:hypothetical protein